MSDEPHLELELLAGIAAPRRYPDKRIHPQGRAAAEPSAIAAAWARSSRQRLVAKHQEESSCDEFATTLLPEGEAYDGHRDGAGATPIPYCLQAAAKLALSDSILRGSLGPVQVNPR